MILFYLQAAIQAGPGSDLRRRLAELIRNHRRGLRTHEKRDFWRQASLILSDATPQISYGVWDFVTAKAEQEHETWASELEAVATLDFDSECPSGDHVVVTLLFLLESQCNAATTLGERCDLPENQWFLRNQFRRLIETPPLLNFTGVLADSLYMSPGPDAGGFTLDDLRGEGFEYLHAIR
ncbi:MAG: hypothetical protein RL095_1852 [Verrucomicrobiota bacterium]|jgi:hypothetical protein